MTSNAPQFPLRSWLCASALKRNLVAKTAEVEADIAHFDLEDSVPTTEKDGARDAMKRHFETRPPIPTALRVNNVGTVDGMKDLLLVVEHQLPVDIIILPKVRVLRDVGLAAAVLAERGHEAKLFAIIETVQALCDFRELATCPPGLSGVIFGAADFATDLGVALDQADLSFVRREIALFARRFGLIAIDSPCFDIEQPDVVKQECDEVRRLGYVGKIAIHPSQVAIINDCFTPSEASVASAKRLLDANEQGGGASILRTGGQMVGPPFMLHAQTVLDRAIALRSGVGSEET